MEIYNCRMKTITVAELRQNPTAALVAVESGETYLVTRHRRGIARLVPVDDEPREIEPARNPGGSQLSTRQLDRVYTHDEAQSLLKEMASDR